MGCGVSTTAQYGAESDAGLGLASLPPETPKPSAAIYAGNAEAETASVNPKP
jgi:hypothetical protein